MKSLLVGAPGKSAAPIQLEGGTEEAAWRGLQGKRGRAKRNSTEAKISFTPSDDVKAEDGKVTPVTAETLVGT